MTKKTVVYIGILKQALHHGLILKKVLTVNQETWLKEYINMNTKLTTEAKKWLWKGFL